MEKGGGWGRIVGFVTGYGVGSVCLVLSVCVVLLENIVKVFGEGVESL